MHKKQLQDSKFHNLVVFSRKLNSLFLALQKILFTKLSDCKGISHAKIEIKMRIATSQKLY